MQRRQAQHIGIPPAVTSGKGGGWHVSRAPHRGRKTPPAADRKGFRARSLNIFNTLGRKDPRVEYRTREAKSGARYGALLGADHKTQQYQSPYCHGSDSHPSVEPRPAAAKGGGGGLFPETAPRTTGRVKLPLAVPAPETTSRLTFRKPGLPIFWPTENSLNKTKVTGYGSGYVTVTGSAGYGLRYVRPPLRGRNYVTNRTREEDTGKGTPMRSKYRAELIGPDGKETTYLPICHDDRSAVNTARTLPGKHTIVEVWDDGRKVGTFERATLKPHGQTDANRARGPRL
jgi:hypothetical protein